MTNPNAWLTKLAIKVTEDNDSPCLIQIEWDETDPELDYWSNLDDRMKVRFLLQYKRYLPVSQETQRSK